jgi:hypothetical protein
VATAISFAAVGLAHRVGHVGIPVAVAPDDRQVDAASLELRLEGRLELAVVLIDRAHAAEVAVVGRDLLEALLGDAATARDVAQERDHVVLPLGAAEAGQEDGVVVGRLRDVLGPALGRLRGVPDELAVGDSAGVGHDRTSMMSVVVMRRPVKKGISSRT